MVQHNDASDLCSDALCGMVYIFSTASYLTLLSLHILLQLFVGSVQLLPFWTLFSIWPRLYYLILTHPRRRSFFQMIRDPRYQASMSSSQACVSCSTTRCFLMNVKVKINPTRLKNGINSGYESYGAYAHLGNSPNESPRLPRTPPRPSFSMIPFDCLFCMIILRTLLGNLLIILFGAS